MSTRPRGESERAQQPRSAGQGAVVEQLVHKLEAAIMSGEIPVNSWLRQESVAAEYKVSRTPLREALRVLQANGMVEVVPNRGALVRGPTPRDIREAYVVRAELEGFAAELAARFIRDDELRQLQEAEELFERLVEEFLSVQAAEGPSPQEASWMQANDRFHLAVQRGAGNLRLQAAIENLHRSFPRNLTWSALSGDSRLLADNVREHRGIRTAIEERDAVTARTSMTEHVQRSGELIVMWFERQEPQQ
jgi:DNA-binding GntR family transcriptional regulator